MSRFLFFKPYEHFEMRMDKNVLREVVFDMIDRLMVEINAPRVEASKVWGVIAQIKELPKWHLSQCELGRIYFECGYAAYRLGAYTEAAAFFKEAFVNFGPTMMYPFGLTYWIYGYILWKLPGRNSEALMAWQRGLDCMRQLEKKASSNGEGPDRYAEIVRQMSDEIERAARNGEVPDDTPASAPPAGSGTGATTTVRTSGAASSAPATGGAAGNASAPARPSGSADAASPGPNPGQGRMDVIPGQTHDSQPPQPPKRSNGRHGLIGGRLKLFKVVETFGAGGNLPTGHTPWTIADVEIETVTINGECFEIYTLMSGSVIDLTCYDRLAAARVQGDSMNMAGLNSGDYVLYAAGLRPDNGDIAVVDFVKEAMDVDGSSHSTGTTIKFYYGNQDSIQLIPQSNNPEHKAHEFEGKEMNKIRLTGKVLAVLKSG
jgi:hypothetical protein